MIRHALIDLTQAAPGDFTDANGYPTYGKVYFVMLANGIIDRTIHYLSPVTNKVEFKSLLLENRIFTFCNPKEVAKICEETVHEWNQVFAPAIQNQTRIEFKS